MTRITFLKNWGANRTVRPNNLLDEEKARRRWEKGEFTTLVFGDPELPDFYIDVFQNMNRIDVTFVADGDDRETYYIVDGALYTNYPRDELFLNQYILRFPGSQQRELDLFFSDAFVDGDFPRFSADDVHAVAADFPACWLGPKPSFEDLCDGRFVERLPKIERPPEALLDPFIPQDQRTPRTPKRVPRGVYPSGEKRVRPGFLAERTG